MTEKGKGDCAGALRVFVRDWMRGNTSLGVGSTYSV